jgi:hypothetical protein
LLDVVLISRGKRRPFVRRQRTSFVKKRTKAAFDPQVFLSKVNGGRTIVDYRKDKIVFSQGDVADAVFYIQTGKIKLPSFLIGARKQSSASWSPATFLAKDVSMAIRCASQQLRRSINA